jgi:hypothetical protein
VAQAPQDLQIAAYTVIEALITDDKEAGVEALTHIAGGGPMYIYAALYAWSGVTMKARGTVVKGGPREGWNLAGVDPQTGQITGIEDVGLSREEIDAARLAVMYANNDHAMIEAIAMAYVEEGYEAVARLLMIVSGMAAKSIVDLGTRPTDSPN